MYIKEGSSFGRNGSKQMMMAMTMMMMMTMTMKRTMSMKIMILLSLFLTATLQVPLQSVQESLYDAATILMQLKAAYTTHTGHTTNAKKYHMAEHVCMYTHYPRPRNN